MNQKIIAVIPCLNEEQHIEALVHYLVRDCDGLAMRIIIADGGSTDRTRALAAQLAATYENVLLLHNKQRIQAAAVNLAVSVFGRDAQYLIRLDAHAAYPENFCRTLIEDAEATGADSVVVAMNTEGAAGFQRAVAAAQNSKLGNGGAAHRNAGSGKGQWVDHGHHALMRLEAFNRAGGYDESFAHNEDAELDFRLRAQGGRIWLTGRTAMTYFPRTAPGSLFLQYFRFGHGRARTILKHKMRPKIRQMAPAAVVPAALLALATPLWWGAAIPLGAWAALCLAYGSALALKSKQAANWAAGPAAMIMHFAWSLGFWKSGLSGLRRRA